MQDSEDKPSEFSQAELVNRLCVGNEEIVRDLYALAIRQLDSEDKREASLTAKAVSLLTASGVSVTVTFALGGILAQRAELLGVLGPPNGCVRVLVALAYLGTVGAGITGGYHAVQALKIGKSKTVSGADLFGKELELADAERRGKDDKTTGSNRYRRFLVAHLWPIYRFNFHRHEKIADRVLAGQRSYLCFLGMLALLALVLAWFLVVVPNPSPHLSTVSPGAFMTEPKSPPPPPPPPTEQQQQPKPPPTTVPSTGEIFKGHVLVPGDPPRKPAK